MEDFQSKYTGEQVEDLLDQVASGEAGGGGGITVETDPIFLASPAHGITTQDINAWNNKVDKVNGKQLSTEDFTSALKAKLEGLSNYDDTELSDALSTLRGDFDKLVSGDTTTAIKTFNEVIAFLDGIADSEDLNSIIASIEQQIANKANADSLAKVATSGSYTDLKNQPTIPSAVTESTVSGWGFTKNTGTYTKPSTGIPFSDFEEQVQGSIIKAEESVQSVSASVTTGNATAGNFFSVTKDSNGNVSIQMIQNTLASGKIAIPYTTDVKQYIDNAVANAGGGGGSTSGIQWTADILEATSGIIQLEPFVVYYGGSFDGGNVTINLNIGAGYQEFRYIFRVEDAPTMYLGVDLWVNGKTPEIKSNRWYELSIAFDDWMGITFGVLTEFLMPE